MQTLRGDPDLALVEFLVGLASSGETVDYIQLYLKDTVGKAQLTAFTTEFLKRKLNDQAGGKRKGKGGSSSSSSAMASAAALTPAPTVSAPANNDWAKIPKKAKGKKGKPVAATNLGFQSSVNYNALATE
mmetsp:Transcript_8280/g.24789  ORF Transcript_8280/g.24789 Transcript_8280/m.24789 type:complete len:130 (+) Transcript_8280:3414-3803(+)